MNAIELSNVSYRYAGEKEHALEDVSLSVGGGDFVLITGPSGSGKSTLCKMLNGLIPHHLGGTLSGSVRVDGLDTTEHPVNELSTHVGLVFQDPESQVVTSDVESEIAFGLENLMLGSGEIGERINWVSERLGIEHLLNRRTSELSGGEKQKVVLASMLALKPRILVLDEPTSQLDYESRTELFKLLKSLNSDGVTVVLVEHNLDGLECDWAYDLGSRQRTTPVIHPVHEPSFTDSSGEAVLVVSGLTGGYPSRTVLRDVSLKILKGECVAVTGANGSGKTTLVKHFNGLLKPIRGSVKAYGMDTSETPTEELARKIAHLPQNPSDMLFCDTAADELELTLKHLNLEGDVDSMLERFNLLRYKDTYPRDLSVGERQRLALAAVLISGPEMVVLDEPTRGIDSKSRETLVSLIREMLSDDKTVVVVTQDRRLVAEVASREIKVVNGVD